jgi:manganese/zinc/iron transport system permease protein
MVMSALSIAFVAALFKELRLAAFDPDLATSLGFRASWINAALMAMVAAATVASFEAVGSILVVAMLVCPAATARMLTDRLRSQVVVSVGVAVVSGVGGYVLGAFGPGWFGGRSVSVTGMMTVVAGVLLGLAVVASPSHGLVAKRVRRVRLAVTVAREDLLATLYRAEERGGGPGEADRAMPAGRAGARARRAALQAGEIDVAPGTRSVARAPARNLRLTPKGKEAAARVVRTHRLWEGYLVREVGLRSDHVHDTAMRVEHLRDEGARRLEPAADAQTDPHGARIPGASGVLADGDPDGSRG